MSKATKRKPYDQMNAEELAEATREFDREMPGVPGKPLTAAQRALHRKAGKVGRPKKGAGAIVVGVSIERRLMKKVDALAKRRNIGRSQLFTAALTAELNAAVAAGTRPADPPGIKGARAAAAQAGAAKARRAS